MDTLWPEACVSVWKENPVVAHKLHKFKRDNQKWLFGLEIRHRTLSN